MQAKGPLLPARGPGITAMKQTVDRPTRNRKVPAARAFTILLLALVSSACRGEANILPAPTPTPSPTATLFIAELPPLASSATVENSATPAAIVTSTPGPHPTPQLPPPAGQLTLIPTTPENRWEACAGAPLSDLHVGDRAYISYDPYLPTRVRSRPGAPGSSVLGLIIPGETVEILDGPACVGRAVWWRVSSLRKDLQGWVQEGDEEGRWLIRAEDDAGVIVPPPSGLLCPVNDESLCMFVNDLDAPVSRGEFGEILARTRLSVCPAPTAASPLTATPQPEGEETDCTYWAVIGRGLGGVALTPVELIEPGWTTYAPAPRRIAALLLPPYENIEPALPPSPALVIETRDPLWDWLFFIEKAGDTWQISALAMVSRDADAYAQLMENPIWWP